jgi:transposase
MGDLSNFERRQIVCALLAVASVTKYATLLGVSRATASKVMSAYTKHGKITVKRNSGRKSTLTERDRHTLKRIVSKNHRTTAALVTAELNIHPEDTVSTKLSYVSFTNPTSTVGLQFLNLRLLKVMEVYK